MLFLMGRGKHQKTPCTTIHAFPCRWQWDTLLFTSLPAANTNPSPQQQEQSEKGPRAQSSCLEATAHLAAVRRQGRLASTSWITKRLILNSFLPSLSKAIATSHPAARQSEK